MAHHNAREWSRAFRSRKHSLQKETAAVKANPFLVGHTAAICVHLFSLQLIKVFLFYETGYSLARSTATIALPSGKDGRQL